QARLLRVQTGVETADRVEVVSGLTATDQVVVAGAETLQSGDRVRVKG
ncbi:MAG: efflux transporter periplasmic adaptor subunit, partial [Acidobacteria bacterium]|nr:efflux transporter periplasmic adaptor subunit [Acidobacteriota bacterium]